MTDLHEEFVIAKRTWGQAIAEGDPVACALAGQALFRCYEQDKAKDVGGAIPMSVPINSIHHTAKIGEGSKVWHFAVVLADVVIGRWCNIGAHCEIGHGTTIGDATRIGSGTFLPPNSRIGRHVFIAPGVKCGDDRHPYVHCEDDPPYTPEPPQIDDGAVIGIGAVLLPGVRIGKHALVAAGSVVTHDVAAGTAVKGNPATFFPLSARARAAYLRSA